MATEAITLIREMAAVNRLWGAERIRGTWLKLDIRVAKTTVQRYMREARSPRRDGRTWATFRRNHVADAWACDFLPATALLFRPLCWSFTPSGLIFWQSLRKSAKVLLWME